MTRKQERYDDVRASILAQLAETTVELDKLPAIYARRLALYQKARALKPPILMEAIAAAAGVTEVAITAALKKASTRASAY